MKRKFICTYNTEVLRRIDAPWVPLRSDRDGAHRAEIPVSCLLQCSGSLLQSKEDTERLRGGGKREREWGRRRRGPTDGGREGGRED